MKSMPVPGASRWCIYLGSPGSPEVGGRKEFHDTEPNGLVGHICKNFDSGYVMVQAFSLGREGKYHWRHKRCPDCKEEVPEEVEVLIGFCK